MATNTPKVSLRKPAGSDAVSVTFDINDNMDKIDARLGDKKQYRKTDGNVTAPAALTLIPGSTLTLKAIVGDWVEASVSGLWNNENVTSYLDAWSRVAGTHINSWGGNNAAAPIAGHLGVSAWYGVAANVIPIGGSMLKQVVANDLDGAGFLNVGFQTTTNGGNKTLFATTTLPLIFHIINHGNP